MCIRKPHSEEIERWLHAYSQYSKMFKLIFFNADPFDAWIFILPNNRTLSLQREFPTRRVPVMNFIGKSRQIFITDLADTSKFLLQMFNGKSGGVKFLVPFKY